MINEMIVKGYCKFKAIMNEEKGDIVQTGVIIGILLVIAIAAFTILRPQIMAAFTKIGGELEGAF